LKLEDSEVEEDDVDVKPSIPSARIKGRLALASVHRNVGQSLLYDFTQAVLTTSLLAENAFPTTEETQVIIEKCIIDFASRHPTVEVHPFNDDERKTVSVLEDPKHCIAERLDAIVGAPHGLSIPITHEDVRNADGAHSLWFPPTSRLARLRDGKIDRQGTFRHAVLLL
jgi:hypothetical protein